MFYGIREMELILEYTCESFRAHYVLQFFKIFSSDNFWKIPHALSAGWLQSMLRWSPCSPGAANNKI